MADLDPEVQAEINRIASKDPSEITAADKIFLQARKSYLGKQTRARLGDILSEKVEVEKPEAPVVDQKHPGQVIEEQRDAENAAKTEQEDELEEDGEDEEEEISQ